MANRNTQRVEAFSDGVFAIAITLLVLEFKVPKLADEAGGRQLYAGLLDLWPSLLSFVMSFWVILVMWINHHELLRLTRGCGYELLFANGLLLLTVTFVPFPTAVLAQYLGTPAENAAAVLYCGTFIAISVAYNLLLHAIVKGHPSANPSTADFRRVRRAYVFGLLVYVAATLLAIRWAFAGLVLCCSLWLLWSRLLYQGGSGIVPAQAE